MGKKWGERSRRRLWLKEQKLNGTSEGDGVNVPLNTSAHLLHDKCKSSVALYTQLTTAFHLDLASSQSGSCHQTKHFTSLDVMQVSKEDNSCLGRLKPLVMHATIVLSHRTSQSTNYALSVWCFYSQEQVSISERGHRWDRHLQASRMPRKRRPQQTSCQEICMSVLLESSCALRHLATLPTGCRKCASGVSFNFLTNKAKIMLKLLQDICQSWNYSAQLKTPMSSYWKIV